MRCSAKHRGRHREPTHFVRANHSACHVRDEAATKSQKDTWIVEKRACQTVRSSSFLISCTINQILRLPAFCRKRCAVQHDRVPSSRLPAHPRAAPGKEKVGGLVGLLSWVLVDLGCVLRSLRCLASSLSLVHSFFCLLDSLHHRSRLIRRSMGRSHGALSQHVLSCGRMIILFCPPNCCYL